MKKQTISKLLSLMKVKTQLEKIRHANIVQRQQDDLAQADRLQRRAVEVWSDFDDPQSESCLQQHAKYSSRLTAKAEQKRRSARSLELAAQAYSERLQHALQRELTLDKLSQRAGAEHRKAENNREENQRELAHAAKSAKTVKK